MTVWQLTAPETLFIGILLLLLGYSLQNKVGILHRNYIPAPVIGGLLCALTVFLLKKWQIAVKFDISWQPFFFAGFFASIGFRATIKMVKANFKKVLIFLALTVGLALIQKLIALGAAPVLALNGVEALAAGAAHMDGGMTKELIIPVLTQKGSSSALIIFKGVIVFSVSVSCLIGGPLFRKLKDKYALGRGGTPSPNKLVPPLLLKHLGAYSLTLLLAYYLSKVLNSPFLPFQAMALLIAATWRNLDDSFDFSNLDIHYLNVLGNVSLSLCLIQVFMNLDLTAVTLIDFRIYLLILLQILVAIALAFLVFNKLGQDLTAALVAAGLPGFALGLPPDTMSTLQCIQENNGPVPAVTFIVPVVGAWWILFINPWLYNLLAGMI